MGTVSTNVYVPPGDAKFFERNPRKCRRVQIFIAVFTVVCGSHDFF